MSEYGVLTGELEEKVKEKLCSEGICFELNDKLEVVARSHDEYLKYVKELLEDVCSCALEIFGDDAVDWVADGMLGDTVFAVEIDDEEYYVRLA